MVEAPEVLPGPSNTDAEVKTNGDSQSPLTDLTAQATLKYSVKDYDAAAELYSQATELQAEINGEMSPQNADLLYAYGRCLYHVAVKNSDVLGSKIAGEKQEGSKKPRNKKPKKGQAVLESNEKEEKIAEEIVTKVMVENDGAYRPEEELEQGKKPYFQFTGDENWDTSDEDESVQDVEDGEEADEEDDFVNAYEVLDLARVLLLNKLRNVESAAGKAKGESQEIQQLNERLADTYDLQAEISLEGERFPAAVVDLTSALQLKLALFPQESSLLAEAHYKLSLALEFSSVTQQTNESGETEAGKEALIDEAMREEAIHQMEAAIASCKLRVQKEEAGLSIGGQRIGDIKKPKATKGDIEDVKEMVKEMEQRVSRRPRIRLPSCADTTKLVELRQPPVSLNDTRGTGTMDGSNPLTSILGSILGESPAAQKARLEEASQGAQDLTDLVKRKRLAKSEISKSTDRETNPAIGKRKNGLEEEAGEVSMAKRARILDGDDG